MKTWRELKPEFKRYLAIGIAVYIFELLVIMFAIKMGFSGVFAVGLSFWLGLILSFTLQKVITFGDKRTHHRVLIPQLGLFSLLVLFNFGFTIIFTKISSTIMPAVLSRTIALGITTIWNFYLYKTKIFKAGNINI